MFKAGRRLPNAPLDSLTVAVLLKNAQTFPYPLLQASCGCWGAPKT
jgi:hypothetical protein